MTNNNHAFIGTLPSGSPLPSTESLANLSDEMIAELVTMLEPSDLLEMCRRDDRFNRYCQADENYRQIMSKRAVNEADDDMINTFFQPGDIDLDMLLVAVTNNDAKMLLKLLEIGEFSPEDLGEALVIAATHPSSTLTLNALLNAGAPLHYANHLPLQSAVLAANPNNAAYLIDQGCPVTAELLSDAVKTRKADIVKMLLSKGANPNIHVNGYLPIEIAALDSQWHLVKILMGPTDQSLISGHAAEKIREHMAATFHRASMTAGSSDTYVSIDNMENILGQIRRQQVDLPKAIAEQNASDLLKRLQRGKFTIADLLEDNIYLSVGSTGNLDLVKVLLNYKDPLGKKVKAAQIPSVALDAIILGKNPQAITFVLNQYQDLNKDSIRIEQFDQKTLLTAALGGPQILNMLLNWRDKNGRGFTINDIVNSGLLEKLIERNDQESISYLINRFVDYNGRRLSINDLIGGHMGPMRALVSTNNPNVHQVFRQFKDQSGRQLQAHHYSQAANLQERHKRSAAPLISPIAFEKLVTKATNEQVAARKDLLVKQLANVIKLHGDELSEAISDNVTKNIQSMMNRGAQFSKAYLESGIEVPDLRPGRTTSIESPPPPLETPSHFSDGSATPSPLPVNTSVAENTSLTAIIHKAATEAAKAAYESQESALEQLLQSGSGNRITSAAGQQALEGIKSFMRQVEPHDIATAITTDPKTIGDMLQGKINAQHLGSLLTHYAGNNPSTETAEWAQATGKLLPQFAQMPNKELGTFEDQVQASFKDLINYPHAQILLMAKKMQIPDCESKDHADLCKEIARKVIYINTDQLPEHDRAKCSRYTKELSSKELNKIRKTIYSKFRKFSNSVTKMSSQDLQNLFTMYDQLCFNGDIEKYMQDAGYTLRFRTSGEETFTTEGICANKICNYTVTIPTEYFKNVNGITNVAGHQCKDQLECLLRVIEHELIHLLIFMFCGDSFITDQHGPLFMKMAGDLFNHTDHRHYIF